MSTQFSGVSRIAAARSAGPGDRARDEHRPSDADLHPCDGSRPARIGTRTARSGRASRPARSRPTRPRGTPPDRARAGRHRGNRCRGRDRARRRPAGLADDVEFAERRLRRELPAGLLGRGPPRRAVPGPEDPQDGRIGPAPRRQGGAEPRARAIAAARAVIERRGGIQLVAGARGSRRRAYGWRCCPAGRRRAGPRPRSPGGRWCRPAPGTPRRRPSAARAGRARRGWPSSRRWSMGTDSNRAASAASAGDRPQRLVQAPCTSPAPTIRAAAAVMRRIPMGSSSPRQRRRPPTPAARI